MSSSSILRFGAFDVTSQVFASTRHALALVNLKPIAPLHVLVIPRLSTYRRLNDLPGEVLGDVFGLVQAVQRGVERATNSHSSTISIQDGPDAGQTVDHLHVHIVPRRKGDFEPNDSIYPKLDEFGLGLQAAHMNRAIEDDARQPRRAEEMKREAQWLASKFFADIQYTPQTQQQ